MQEIRYGFKYEEPKKEDHNFGGFTLVPKEVLIPDGDWRPYLPMIELQNLRGVEPFACVSFTILTCIEAIIFCKYGIKENFSDRFLAAISGTEKRRGNSPQNVCEFLRKIGAVDEEDWPFNVNTFEEYYGELPPKLNALAKSSKINIFFYMMKSKNPR